MSENATGLAAIQPDGHGPFGRYRPLQQPTEFGHFSLPVQDILQQLLDVARLLGQADVGSVDTHFTPSALGEIVGISTLKQISDVLREHYQRRLVQYEQVQAKAPYLLIAPEPKHSTTRVRIAEAKVTEATLLHPEGSFQIIIHGRRQRLFGKRPQLRLRYYTPASEDGRRESVTFAVESTEGRGVFFTAIDFAPNAIGTELIARNGLIDESPPATRRGFFDDEGKRLK